MGVEYRHFVIPRDNTVRPAPEQVAALIEAWLAAGFVARPGSAAHQRMTFGATKTSLAAKDTGAILLTKPLTAAPFPVPPSPDAMRILAGPEALIRWPVENLAQADLQYPLTPVPDFGRRGEGAYGEGPYYDLELHLSDDFIHTDSETIDVLPQTSCDCGTQLEYEPDLEDVFYAARIRRLCPACGRAFRPQDQMATITDGFTGARSELAGGATYRFAISINCGKCFQSRPKAAEPFLTTCRTALRSDLYEVGTFF